MTKVQDGVGRYAFCTRCGGNDFKVWWENENDWARCEKCGCRASFPHLQYNVRELATIRVYLAISWLSASLSHGATRKQIADWLGLPKSPRLINIIEGIANTPSVSWFSGASPLNGRRTRFYLFWTDLHKADNIMKLGEGIAPPDGPNWGSKR
jgi:hypothetical protein